MKTSPQQSNHQGRPSNPDEWALYLQSLIKSAGDPYQDNQTLSRELAKPYSLDAPLILHHIYQNTQQNPNLTQSIPDPILREPSRYPDLYLWWALTNPSLNPPSLNPLSIINLNEKNALFPQDNFTTIEVWTETELAALHALSHHARYLHQTDLNNRIRRTIDWHIQNTQPDNATNHPWAVHAFLLRNTPESIHFAETLINNTLVQNAHPDPFSARILLDAAISLTTLNTVNHD